MKKNVKNTLRSVAILFSFLIICAIGILAIRIIPHVTFSDSILANKGLVDFQQASPDSLQPLFGEWEYFPNVYVANSDELDVLQSPIYMNVPINNIVTAQKGATFRLQIDNAHFDANSVLYLQNLDSPIKVYLNGVEQKQLILSGLDSLRPLTSEIYSLSSFDTISNTQELILSIKEKKENAPLFKRVPVISSVQQIQTLSSWKSIIYSFLYGLLIFIVLNALAFLLLRPQQIIITCITFFDTVLIIRLFFASENLHEILESLFSFIYFTDTMLFSTQLFLILFSGIGGVSLLITIFDPDKKIPRYFTYPAIAAYFLLAVTLPFNYELYYGIGQYFLAAIYVYTIFLIVWHIITIWRKYKNGFALFSMCKVVFVTIFLFVDITSIGTYVGFPVFYYPLIMFFYMQMFVKLMDTSSTYNKYYQLNQQLENLVEERTKELSEKNKKLSELSTHDPLTSIHNRLYFDEQLDIALAIFDEKYHTLHLCMFDLDHFKSINDTYGHAAGDEQLIHVARTVESLLLKNSIFARVGGEEFMILYTEANTDKVLSNIEEIRSSFYKKAKENKQFTTSSFGVTKYRVGLSKKDILKYTDNNLYEAKSTGRNKAVFTAP